LDGINIKIKLQKLAHHRKIEKWGKAEPYLWVIFFKIDGTCVEITPQFRLDGHGTFQFMPGSHGNLGISSNNEDNIVTIPAHLGEWKTYLEPFQIPYFEQSAAGLAGVIAVLMEQNNVSFKGAEAGHQALNKKVEAAVNQSLMEFDPRYIDVNDVMPSIKRFFEAKVAQFTDTIQDDITNAIKSNQKLLRNLWSLVNPDNLIGYHVWNFNQKELLESENHSIDFSNRWDSESHGDWEIFGNIKIIDDGFAQQDALKATKGKASSKSIYEIHGQRASDSQAPRRM
jgi:hypothetical protein